MDAMARIVEYRICAGTEANDITQEVNKLLEEGWELYGELKTTGFFAKWGRGEDEQTEYVYGYDQAMVRREGS